MQFDARKIMCFVSLFVVGLLAPRALAQPVGTAFSYQGAISDAGTPVDGPLDFRLSLWEDPLGGTQIGPMLNRTTNVANGLFSLELDFGAEPFALDAALWLQVEVSNDGGGNWTTLPRNRLAPAPHSLSTRGLSVTPDGKIGIGNLGVPPQGRLHVLDSENNGQGIHVQQDGSGNGVGVHAEVNSGTGVYGHATGAGTGYGVRGEALSDNGWGVYAVGRIAATGTKSFAIDHPLNPGNMILLHYSTEAPEPLNTYSGTVILDGLGQATVALPDYFEAINTDVRYQLTAIGAPAPNLHVATEVWNNEFSIAGGAPGLKVSWQVTARRDDAFVRQRGAPVEMQKAHKHRGRYLMPDLFGLPASMSIHAVEPASER